VRVVFLGTPATAVPALARLIDAGHDVALVITQPDRPAGRSRRPLPPPVKACALDRGLRVEQPTTVRTPGFLATLQAARPEVLAVVAYGRILPRPVLDVAPHGAINVHFSLLPAWRGAAPVPWALAHGERVTGVTTFRLDEGVDTGDVLLQKPVAIEAGEHAPALLERLAEEGAALLVATLAGLGSGAIRPVPQDHARASRAPILTREDGWWDPSWSAADLEGRVRGFDPWPGVWVSRAGTRMRIVRARALSGATTDANPGSVLALEGDAARLSCAGGTVAAIDAVQFEGRRAMTAREASHGRQLLIGDRLGRIEPAA
jgi:methionyl-tRNA formyltransferase